MSLSVPGVQPASATATLPANVTIASEPSCTPVGALDAAGRAWLGKSEIQADVFALDEALKPYAHDFLGTAIDLPHRRALVVLHQDSSKAASVAAAIGRRVHTLQVVVLPACHSRAQITEAEAILLARKWHPKAASTSMGFSLDPAIAGFDVTVDTSAPEVARALEETLGTRVRVSLDRVRRH